MPGRIEIHRDRVCQSKGVNGLWFSYFRPADRGPSKVISNALSASFHRLDQRCLPRPVGSRLMIARYTHLRAAASVGK